MTEQRPMRGPFKGWRRLALWKQIFIALIAGLVVGVSLNMAGMPEVATSIKPIGDLFIRGIKMLIVPLVFVSLVTGVSSLDDISTMGRLSVKTVALYLITTAIAIVIGLILAVVFQPGSGVAMVTNEAVQVREAPPLVDIFLTLCPPTLLSLLLMKMCCKSLYLPFSLGCLLPWSVKKHAQYASFLNLPPRSSTA